MKRLTILCGDVPYPATHGGRVDRWNRIIGLRKLGVEVQVVIWPHDNAEAAEAQRALSCVGCQVVTLQRKRRLLRYIVGTVPGRIDSFRPDQRANAQVKRDVVTFRPDAVIADGIEPMLCAQEWSLHAHAQLIYRSHNVEHLYWSFQRSLARGLSRLPFVLAVPRMKFAERSLREAADVVLDICEEDREWWVAHGLKTESIVLPPTWNAVEVSVTSAQVDEPLIVFAGNLYSPNNVDGLTWFAESILPRVKALSIDRLRVVFAGSRPSPSIRGLCRRHGIECVASPSSLEGIRNEARVLINPVRFSSGVNIKMFEMIGSGRPIVSTSQGARGIPGPLKALVTIADTDEAFALAVSRHLSEATDTEPQSRQQVLMRECGPAALVAALGHVKPLAAVARREEFT